MKRLISKQLLQELKKNNKVLLLIGQRRTGKTYELKRLQQEINQKTLYFDFEDLNTQQLFTPKVSELEELIGEKNQPRLILFDEIQYLANSGSVLKLIHDHFPKTKVVATGSAALLLLKNIGDSLYGRSLTFKIYPLTFREILGETDKKLNKLGQYNKKINQPKLTSQLKTNMIYGSLPEVCLEKSLTRKEKILTNYVNSLLFKDIFEVEGVRRPQIFKKLISLLALQIGSEVNPNELAQKLEINRKTVVEYIGLYEKFQIIYTLPAFSNNPRKEITRGFKVYFVDLGIRNAVIDNFISFKNRSDKGSLFENLVVNTLTRNIDYFNLNYKPYFWRSFNQAEVDLVLENRKSNQLTAIEIKWQAKTQPSQAFENLYKKRLEKSFCINQDNFWRFI